MNKQKRQIKAGFAAVALFATLFLIGAVAFTPAGLWATTLAVGDPIPAVSCSGGLTATVYAEGLASPDGLAINSLGELFVAEETGGEITKIGADGSKTLILDGLSNPEGITFDQDDNLYVVEDVDNTGQVIKRTPAGALTIISNGLSFPEGVVVGADGKIYVTASDAEKALANPTPPLTDFLNYKTYLYAFASTAPFTRTTLLEIQPDIPTSIPPPPIINIDQPSFAGITINTDGKLYFSSESSGIGSSRQIMFGPFSITINISSTKSVFVVDPASPPADNSVLPPPFAEHMFSPEGLRFSNSGFPLYVVEEGPMDPNGLVFTGTLHSVDAAGTATVLCTGFGGLEDVAVDAAGVIYVTDDTNNRIVKIAPAAVATETPANTPTATETETPLATATATATSTRTITATPTGTLTAVPTETPTETPVFTATPTSTSTSVPSTPGPSDTFIYLPLVQR